MRRVVVTGMGVVTPLGNTLTELWSNLLSGASGVAKLTADDINDLDQTDVKIGGRVSLDPEIMKNLPFAKNKQNAMAFSAASSAIEDSKWNPSAESEKERTGVIMGATKSHLSPIVYTVEEILKSGLRSVPNLYHSHLSIFGTTANVVKKYGFKGPTSAYSSACAAGSCSLAEAFWAVRCDEADVMVTGTADNGIHNYLLSGLSRLGALNKKANDRPQTASCPFDMKRDGFIAADGAGCLVLEELNHALSRNAYIYGELKGASLSSESFHPSRPHPEGEGIARTMRRALEIAELEPRDIDLIHAHGTSTVEGDISEIVAINNVFGNSKPAVISAKANYGHMMAGVGAIQSAVLLLCMKHSMIPPLINLKNPVQVNNIELNYVLEPRAAEVNAGITNNAGFGGLNCSLVFSKYKQ